MAPTLSADESERRRHKRDASAAHQVLSARVRPGHDAQIIDLSSHGVLLELPVRLLPGALVDVQFDRTTDRTALGGRVVRSTVVRLSSSVIWYQAAVAFERPLAKPAEARDVGVEGSHG